jgi:DNA excision repair protein ERCC-4
MATISEKLKIPLNSNYPKIIMDERERNEIRRAFEKYRCDLQIKTIYVADYMISPEIGIERKRGDDLTASICDNRFFI